MKIFKQFCHGISNYPPTALSDTMDERLHFLKRGHIPGFLCSTYISSMFNLHYMGGKKERNCLSLLLRLSGSLTLSAREPIRPLGSTLERLSVKATTDENGPCPLIYRLSREEGPSMHLKLTSCVQRAISRLFLFHTALFFLKTPFSAMIDSI